MNTFLDEFLKISLGVALGGLASTPIKVVRLYNSTQMSISQLEHKLDLLNENLRVLNRCLMDYQVKIEFLDRSLEDLGNRVTRIEAVLESKS